MSRKDFFVKVLAAVQNSLNETNNKEATLDTETLTSIAKAYGYVEGKRGRDGGYQATDAGLTFVGEDVGAFLVTEAQEQEQREAAAKDARKAAAKQSQENLKAQLASALKDAA